uniref:Uncharacterized protein n=1 Tax=Rhizophora mucronata TaxID=61149 RepID=A0A2P2NMR5_RHIMU
MGWIDGKKDPIALMQLQDNNESICWVIYVTLENWQQHIRSTVSLVLY